MAKRLSKLRSAVQALRVVNIGTETSLRNVADPLADEPEAIVEIRSKISSLIDNLVEDTPSEAVKLWMALVAQKLDEPEAARIIIDTHGLSKFGLKR